MQVMMPPERPRKELVPLCLILVVSFKLSVVSFKLSVVSFQLSVVVIVVERGVLAEDEPTLILSSVPGRTR